MDNIDESKSVEEFDFGITNGSIHKEGKCFHPYVGGSGVGGPATTIDCARKLLFERLKEDLCYRARRANQELVRLNELLKTLGDDPFNMGVFKKFNK